MRTHLALLGALLVGSLAHADVTLTAKRIGPTTVELDWTAGTADYGVYRSALPSGVASSGNFLALSGGTTYTDGAASGSILFYLVDEGACSFDADCPPTGNGCLNASCSAHSCTTVPVQYGTDSPDQTAGDCQQTVCDGNGGSFQAADDLDVPNDGNDCTSDTCSNGVPGHIPLADGITCTNGDGSECENAVCMPTVSLVRVGDGSGALSTSATAVAIERRKTDGTLLSTVALPTAISGSNQQCTLAGTATAEGGLSRSADDSYLTLAGYGANPGSPSVASSNPTFVPRVVCRVDVGGNIDTTTRLTSAFSSGDVKDAVSNDGTTFWVSGASTGSSGGIWYATLGAAGGTQVLSSPTDVRTVGIYGGQLYADSPSSPTTNVFTVGSGLPTTTGQSAGALTGLPSLTNSEPEGFAFFDLNPNVAGIDTLYLADSRGLAMGGGIQKWTWNGTAWTQVATFNSGITAGIRDLAAAKMPDGTIAIFATTVSAPVELVKFIDDFVHPPTATVLATAPARYSYRGVAISPH
ncbi:MAG TPA: hypothetical protein VFV19_07210 [Candidatus Polarisedimenticolaceae bacterium]|nr:hypothetical protein [Candidatus Polarisedimenticolaceae bacterium]